MTNLILARAERLALLTDTHKARKAHKPVKALEKRLQAVTAKIAAMEAQYA